MAFDVRKAFYSVVCFATLGLSAWGAYTILSVGMRTYIFTEADRSYPYPRGATDDSVGDREEADRKNSVARRQAEFSWALPVLIINLPMFFLFYPEVKKKE